MTEVTSLPVAGTPSGAEPLATVQDGLAKKISLSSLAAWIGTQLTLGQSPEEVRDNIAATLVEGTGINLIYNDAADTITIESTGGAGGGLDAEGVRDTMAAALVGGTGITITPNDAGDTITIAATGGGGGLDAEAVRDTIGSALVAGSGITITVNDAGDTITISSASVSPASSMRTAYIDTIPLGLISDVPDNVRTGLSAATATGGGFEDEMAIAVTGTAGSKVLTTSETAKVAGLGADPWDGVLNSTDGTQDFPVVVRTNNGSTTITLDCALLNNFTGTLSSKNPVSNDQHITEAATRAYAQIAAEETGYWACRGGIRAGVWNARPVVTATMGWVKNATSTAYGVQNSATIGGDGSTLVQSNLFIDPVENIQAAKVAFKPLGGTGYGATGVVIGTHAVNHGMKLDLDLGGMPTALEFFTGAHRGTYDLLSTGVRIGVTVTLDTGHVIYSKEATDVVTRHRVALPEGVWKVATVECKNLDGGIYNIYATQLTAREPGVGGLIRGKKALVMMDSWGAYYNAAFYGFLAAKTGMTVVNDSLGGMTTEWALDRLETRLNTHRPDIVYMDFGINEMNSGNWSATFTALDGSTKQLFPVANAAAAIARLLGNISKIETICNKWGARLVWMMPTGLAGIGQTQSMMSLRWAEDSSYPTDGFSATTAEKTNTASFINTRGKYKGKQLLIGGAIKTAASSNAVDDWQDKTGDAVAGLQQGTLVRSNYVATPAFTIGVDDDANGLSNGLRTADYGTITGHTYTPSIVGGAQRFVGTFPASPGGGNRRVWMDFTTVNAKEYLAFVQLSNIVTSSGNFDTIVDIGASVNSFDALGATIVNDGTNRLYYLRQTATASGTKSLAIGPWPAASATSQFDIVDAGLIDIASLPGNIQSLSDAEIIAFVRSLGDGSLAASKLVSDTGTIAPTSVGFRGAPQVSKTAAYTLALTDSGKHISITTGGVIIPANASVAFPIGTVISIYNDSASSQTISITTDTLRLAGTATTGSRTLAQRGLASVMKVKSNEWVISGGGLT